MARSPRYEIYEDSRKEWRFRLKAPNGEIIASSEGYSSKQNAKKGIRAIKKYADSKLFEIIDNTLIEIQKY